MYILNIQFEKCLCAITRSNKCRRRLYFIKRSNIRDWGNTFLSPLTVWTRFIGFISWIMSFLTCEDREYFWPLNRIAEGRHIFLRRQHTQARIRSVETHSNQSDDAMLRRLRLPWRYATKRSKMSSGFSLTADLESVTTSKHYFN